MLGNRGSLHPLGGNSLDHGEDMRPPHTRETPPSHDCMEEAEGYEMPFASDAAQVGPRVGGDEVGQQHKPPASPVGGAGVGC